MQKELEKGKFILNIDGKDIVYDTILTFYNTKFQKNYVVYSVENDENMNLYASSYNPNSTYFTLDPVEKDEEWNVINNVLNDYFKEVL